MLSHNQKIFEFLEYYCQLSESPQYAVLLKGAWGSGKTQFINQFIEKRNSQSLKSLLVSTYGMSSFKDIEDEFFRLLHPKLSSKKAVLAGKVVKGFLKGALKIDLNNDGREDGTISPTIPDINLPDYLTNLEDFVIVFDDLERSNINILKLLGYINHLVEHGGHKVILIANEDEIRSEEQINKDDISYQRAKEKLIGKTFELQPETDIALKAFIDKYPENQKEIFTRLTPEIVRIYNQSLYQNLRHIRQALDDFLRLLNSLPENLKSHNDLIQALLTNYLIFSFEIKSGHLKPAQLRKLTMSDWVSFMNGKGTEDPEQPISIITKKYPDFSLYDLVLSLELWEQLFEKGIFDTEKLISEVENSKYFFTEDTPTWKKLWYAYELTDEEIKSYLDIVHEEFVSFKHHEVEVFLHIFGNLLFLSECKIYPKSRAQILKLGKKYIDHLKKNNLLAIQADNLKSHFAQESSHNLGYQERDSAEFKEIYEYLIEKINQAVLDDYPQVANYLLDLMSSDNFKFCQHLQLNNDKDNLYYKIPILIYIDPRRFANKFISLSQRNKWNIESLLKNRYGFVDFNQELKDEADWLVKVARIFTTEANKHPKTMKKRNLLIAAQTFKAAAEHLRN
ncbi:P-loop NTPase fold protein [Methylophilus sp. YYY-1]|uniref:P-loop NTPase fold protein n=1 Tax=Methylophilus sp. YYY-1 TaxID=2682087 RepID=UPI0023B27669|nr:P-loop NTPase fold protein [Methylophilus sp. YYY-1]MDF0378524.1 hypothetical protein [Methylophilus sp. YYY-1]